MPSAQNNNNNNVEAVNCRISGSVVGPAEQNNVSQAIQCAKLDCETVWISFHKFESVFWLILSQYHI